MRVRSAASGLPFEFVKSIQMLYELQTLMVPVINFTAPTMPKGYEALARIPWRGPGCTGIIATDKSTGIVCVRLCVPICARCVAGGVLQRFYLRQ
jgi:hypothetical protein